MKALFDASALVAMISEEAQTAAALQALRDAEVRFTLDLAAAEIANALWRKQRAGLVPPGAVQAALSAALQSVDHVVATAPHAPAALDLALSVDHPVYDCLYAAAARALGATLVTGDARFARRLVEASASVSVRVLEGTPA
jgi:predicted nucleic acid-binding protein